MVLIMKIILCVGVEETLQKRIFPMAPLGALFFRFLLNRKETIKTLCVEKAFEL